MSGNFKCSVCRRAFSSFAMLREHSREHQKQTRHCSNCGANFPKQAFHRC
ncbi:MAG: C2H2-type zinc finger protein [Pyrinomonadaceae bacterium]